MSSSRRYQFLTFYVVVSTLTVLSGCYRERGPRAEDRHERREEHHEEKVEEHHDH